MEATRKRKASNATPSSAEGSASKKLRLLVRLEISLLIVQTNAKVTRCLGTHGAVCNAYEALRDWVRWCSRKREELPRRSKCRAWTASIRPKPAPPSYSAWRPSPPRDSPNLSSAPELTRCALLQNTTVPKSNVQEVGFKIVQQLRNATDKT